MRLQRRQFRMHMSEKSPCRTSALPGLFMDQAIRKDGHPSIHLSRRPHPSRPCTEWNVHRHQKMSAVLAGPDSGPPGDARLYRGLGARWVGAGFCGRRSSAHKTPERLKPDRTTRSAFNSRFQSLVRPLDSIFVARVDLRQHYLPNAPVSAHRRSSPLALHSRRRPFLKNTASSPSALGVRCAGTSAAIRQS
jgi:hypothetical protein